MIALLAGDDVTPLRFSVFDMILPRKFQRRLGCFGTARDEINAIQITWRMVDQKIRQSLGRFGREKARMRKGQVRQLFLHRFNDFLIAMTKAGNGGPP